MFNLLFNSLKNDTISPSEVKTRLANGQNIILLDVRMPEEYQSGHIPKSILLPVDRISTNATNVIPNKETEIIVYCHSGIRAKNAVTELKAMGYTQVKNLGGIIHWPYEIVTK